MNTRNQIRDVLGRIRQAADQSLQRLRGAQKPAETGAPQSSTLAPLDPTVGRFGEADDGFDDNVGALPLGALLEASAQDMVSRRRRLHDQANELVKTLAARANGEVTLAIQGTRFLIGAVWVAAAFWLYVSAAGYLNGSFSALANGMPAQDALALAWAFFPLGAAGIGVALLVGALVRFSGNASDHRVKASASDLGIHIADTARAFDEDLTRLRQTMDNRNNPADAVDALSRTYITALGAQAYFREIEFLTSEGEEAKRKFRGFLRRDDGGPDVALVFLLGFLIGALAITILYVPRPALPDITPPEIAKYPWAANLILFGAFLYAVVGAVLSLFGGVLSAGARAHAQNEALNALRGAFTAREAPRP